MVDYDLICGDAIKELQKMEELKEMIDITLKYLKKLDKEMNYINYFMVIK